MQNCRWLVLQLLPFFTLVVLLSVKPAKLYSQVLPVGTQVLEDRYRRDQLLGLVDSTISFTIRPLTAAALERRNVFNPGSAVDMSSVVYPTPDDRCFVRLFTGSFQYRYIYYCQ